MFTSGGFKQKIYTPGTKFSRLTVIRENGKLGSCIAYLCRCDCGNLTTVRSSCLIKERTRSCGCLFLELKQQYKGSKNPNWNFDREHIKKMRKISDFIHRTIRRTLKSKDDYSETILGYTKRDLWEHLETQFDRFMTWDNYGKYWVIDHIKPIVVFIKEGIEDPKIINALSNLQPLSKSENRKKWYFWEE